MGHVAKLAANPMALAQAQMNMYLDYMRLWQSSCQAPRPASDASPRRKGDARFKDDEWQSNFVFDYVKQSYLIAARHIHGVVSNVEGIPTSRRRRSTSSPASTSTRSARPTSPSPTRRCCARP